MEYADNIRLYSLLGQCGTYGITLKKLASENKSIIALSADSTKVSGLSRYAMAYPDRFYNVGIAEEGAIGIAAGLADRGFVPFVSAFTNFLALRANEFIRHFMAYMKCNIKLVGLGGGFAMELFGNTHYGLEDISVLRSMPNIVIFSPADGLEVAKIISHAAQTSEPTYIRLSGKTDTQVVHKTDFHLIPGKAVKMIDGEDVVIFATGSMVSVSLKASEILSEQGVSVALYDVHTIKPFDTEAVINNKDKKLIVSAEEHCKTGGLGSSVAEVLATQPSHGSLLRIGTGDDYKLAGDYNYMLQVHGLTPGDMAKAILGKIKESLI